MAILTNYEGSNDDLDNRGTNGGNAQGFQVPSNSTCTSITLYGSRGVGATGTFALQIYSGTIDGTQVKTETFNTSVLTAYDGSPHWDEITWTASVALTAGTQYFLRIVPQTGSATDEIRSSVDTTSPSYSNGARWYLASSVWTEQSGVDMNFRVNGSVDAAATGNFFQLF